VEGGWIHLDAHCRNGSVFIVVENNFDPEAPPRRKGGVGLANVRQRLDARYGENGSFAAKSEDGRFRVAIAIPVEREERTS
jgi:LytS/YehU family sensor histidine kinase